MTINSNNSNWKLIKDGEFPNDQIYETSFILKKYKDLNNKQVVDTKKIVARANADIGNTILYESTNGVLTKIQSRDKDGNITIFDENLNTSYFSLNDGDTAKQYNDTLKTSKTKIVDENFKKGNGQFGDITNWNDYKSDLNIFIPSSLEINSSQSIDAAEEEKETSGSTETFRYPLTQVPEELGYDFIRITAYKYKKDGINELRFTAEDSARKRLIKTSEKQETIILPMQPNFSESNAVSWGGDNLDPIRLAGAQLAGGGISFIGGEDNEARQLLNDLGADFKSAIEKEDIKKQIVAYFAGQAVGSNILTRGTGTTLNPNLELLFNGPNLRTFNFNFRFTPRTQDESLEIKKIIRILKRNMAVQRASNLFLHTPNIFTLEYIYNSKGNKSNQLHPFLNVFKPMAMRNLSVNYTPDGSYMTYENGSLTQYDLQMSFGELEPIYAEDYDDGDQVGSFSNHSNMGF